MLLALSVPPDNDRGPQYMEQALSAIHQVDPRRPPITFLFGTLRSMGTLLPPELAPVLEAQIGAHYPSITIERLPHETLLPPSSSETWFAHLRLHPDVFPIRRYAQFEDLLNRNATDPLGGILAALNTGRSDVARSSIEIIARPANPGRVKHARRILRHLASSFFPSHPTVATLYGVLPVSVCESF